MPYLHRIVVLQLEGHVIRVTPDHPFFTDNGWVDAGDLRAGDLLRTRDGTWATVQAVHVEVDQPVHQPAAGFGSYP